MLKTKITEDQLVKLFLSSPISSKKSLGFEGHAIEQLETVAGVPDVVVIPKAQVRAIKRYAKRVPHNFLTNSYAKVLSVVLVDGESDVHEISEKTGLSVGQVKKTIRGLKLTGQLAETGEGRVRLGRIAQIPRIDVWSFEFKLSDWKGAIHQSLRHRNFATYSVVVMPSNKKKLLEANREVFKKFRLGSAVFDENAHTFEYIVSPQANEGYASHARIDTFGRLAKNTAPRIAQP